ncbi:hypothetical protein RRG08_006039, partial [Elysia crispata]
GLLKNIDQTRSYGT